MFICPVDGSVFIPLLSYTALGRSTRLFLSFYIFFCFASFAPLFLIVLEYLTSVYLITSIISKNHLPTRSDLTNEFLQLHIISLLLSFGYHHIISSSMPLSFILYIHH